MLLQSCTVRTGGNVFGDRDDVCFGADQTSPSGAVGAVTGGEDVLSWEEGRLDLT